MPRAHIVPGSCGDGLPAIMHHFDPLAGDLSGATEDDRANVAAASDPNAAPAHTARFRHYSICINSEDGLAKAASSFDMAPPQWAFNFQPNVYFDGAGDDVTSDTAPTWRHGLRAATSNLSVRRRSS